MADDGASQSRDVFSNHGGGTQNIHAGSGTQNSNTGSGIMYSIQNAYYSRKRVEDEGYKRFCADLRVTDPRDDMDRIISTKGGLLEESYTWILQHEDFHRWKNATDTNKLLWIKGDPGKGKTMLLCGIVKELEKTDITPAYFFCQATDIQLNTATNVLRGLLYMFVRQHPSLFALFRKKHEDAGKTLFEDKNAWTVLREMIQTARHQEMFRNAVIVIDALDECTKDLDQLIDFIIDISSTVKVVTSSRNWPTIESGMARAPDKIPICLELSHRAISDAVTAFIDARMDLLLKFDDETRKMIRSYLIKNSGGTFLWVALVCRQLEDSKTPARRAPRMIKDFPPGLEKLYARMLDEALSSYDKETCRQILAVVFIVYRPVSLSELMTLIAIENDTSKSGTQWLEEIVGECGSLLVIKKGIVNFVHQSTKDFLTREEVICRVMPDGIRHEHHLLLSKSFQMMEKTLRNNIYNIESPGASIDLIYAPNPDPLSPIKYSCLYWTDHVEDWSPVEHGEASKVVVFLEKRFLQWVEARSLLCSFGEGIGNLQKLLRFTTALGSKTEGESGEVHMTDVMVSSTAGPSRLTAFVQDALRFMRNFREGIEQSPLQVYPSLIFSPSKSLIKQAFQGQEPAWIVGKPEVDEQWSPHLQKFRTPIRLSRLNDIETIRDKEERIVIPPLDNEEITEIKSMAFSADGAILASSSDKGTIDLWNTATGWCTRLVEMAPSGIVRSPEMEDYYDFTFIFASSVAFSPDDSLLLSSWTDGTIQLWDVASKAHLRAFHQYDGPASVAIFATDGGLVASGSVDGVVKVWQTTTGLCLHSFEGHGNIFSMAFSLKNDILASMSACGGIKVRNLPTGTCWETESQAKAATAVNTGSIDFAEYRGTELIAISTYIQRFNASTGKLLGTNYLGANQSDAIAISRPRNQKRLAYVDTSSNQVTLIDPITCEPFGRITGAISPIRSMAFSNDGLWLATNSYGPEIKIWDTALAVTSQQNKLNIVQKAAHAFRNLAMPTKRVQMTEVADILEKGSLVCLVFSQDGKQLAATLAVRDGYDVYVWEWESGKCISAIRWKPSKPFTYFKVSVAIFGSNLYGAAVAPHGQSWGQYVKICTWDIKRGKHLRDVEYVSELEDLALSNDGNLLAVASSGNIKVWDTSTGTCTLTIPTNQMPVQGMRFSFSGSHIFLHSGYGINMEAYDQGIEPPEWCLEGHYAVSDNGEWITKDFRNIVWLPETYRPRHRGIFAIHESTVALGTQFHSIVLLRFP